MNIIKFKKQKNGFYQLYLEDGDVLLLHEEVILKHQLLLNRKLLDENRKILEQENDYYLYYQKALNQLKKKLLSVLDMEEFLKNEKVDVKTIEKIVEQLTYQGYLNDTIFVDSFIHDKIALSQDGPLKIKGALLSHGISSNLLEKVEKLYSKELEMERLDRLILKLVKTNKNKSRKMLEQYILNYLTKLGYHREYIDVSPYLVTKDDTTLYQKEYDKLYRKLSRKYTGSALEFQIKRRLYLKGLNNDGWDS